MEEKQKFPTATGFSGKTLIASLFILSGILLFARNMGWITSEVFDMIVSWHSLLIILGIYSMIRRHFIGGIILLLIGVYFLIGGLSWLPENSQAMVWPDVEFRHHCRHQCCSHRPGYYFPQAAHHFSDGELPR